MEVLNHFALSIFFRSSRGFLSGWVAMRSGEGLYLYQGLLSSTVAPSDVGVRGLKRNRETQTSA